MAKKINGQQVGYIRVSSLLQNESRQLEGMGLDTVFTDKISGKDKNRPELTRCLNHLRAGDKLHVHSIDRLARNLRDLESIVTDLTGKGISVIFHKESLTFTGDDNPMQTLMLQIIGACAQFELSMIKERQKEGIAIAKKKGKQIGRKAALNEIHVQEVKDLWISGKNKKEIAASLGVSRVTFYDFIKKYDIELKTQNIS